MGNKAEIRRQVSEASAACADKKAEDITILQLDPEAGGFTDYFVICSGSNPRQIQAISDEVERKLSERGARPAHVEGYRQAEWVLLDYVDFVVHVFSEKARKFYSLERLWKSAKQLMPSQLRPKMEGKVKATPGRSQRQGKGSRRRTRRP